MTRRATLFALLLPLWLVSPCRPDDVRDGVATPTVPSRLPPSQPREPAFDFVAPPTPEAIEAAFWAGIRRLEQRQQASGGLDGRRLVARIRRDLASIPDERRFMVMTKFLELAFHYRAQHNPDAPPPLQAAHEAAFLAGVRGFREMALREQDELHNSVYMNLFAEIRALAGAGPEGLRLSQELARLDPKNPAVQRSLAQDQLEAGNYPAALAAAQRALELDPGASSPHTVMAGARYAMQDFKGAHAEAQAALRADPEDQVAYTLLKLTDGVQLSPVSARAALAETFPQARPHAPAVSARPDASGLPFPEPQAPWRRLSEPAGAQPSERTLAADPGGVTAFFWRAQAHMRLGALDKALGDADAASKLLAAPDPVLLLLRAEILNRLRRHSEALEAAEQGLAAKPGSPQLAAELYFQKAWALAGLGRRREAVAALAQAMRMDKRFEPYHRALLALPEEADPMALFAGALVPQRERPALSGRGRDRRDRMLLTVALSSLAGGLLIALGLLQFSGASRWRERVKAALSSEPWAPPEPAGSLLAGSYEIARKIGEGGMGVVFEAMDRNLRRRVAVKRLREEINSDPQARERILQEARTVAQLRHPNIVDIYSVLSDASGVYLIFELIDGITVAERIRADERLPFAAALGILRDVAAALDYAHARGVIHRDLKPSNIMLRQDGTAKVMDFGVAQHDGPRRDPRAGAAGTPHYMAPEQEQGRTRKESDVYAMGVTLYEMVTGRRPFAGLSSGGLSLGKTSGNYFPPSALASGLPPGLDQVLSWALAPDPDKRWRSPGQFRRALESLTF